MGIKALGIAKGKLTLTWMQAFMRGICCNWLVCLAVWMAFAAKDIAGKIFAIFFPIMAFVSSGFEHSVANMFFIPMGITIAQWRFGWCSYRIENGSQLPWLPYSATNFRHRQPGAGHPGQHRRRLALCWFRLLADLPEKIVRAFNQTAIKKDFLASQEVLFLSLGGSRFLPGPAGEGNRNV